MAHENDIIPNGATSPTIPLLTDPSTGSGYDPPPPAASITLPTVFLLGANAVSHLLTGQPPLEMLPVAQLITTRDRLHHWHIATAEIEGEPLDMLIVLGMLLRE